VGEWFAGWRECGFAWIDGRRHLVVKDHLLGEKIKTSKPSQPEGCGYIS